MALPQAWQPEQLPTGLRLAPADSAPAEQGDNRLRPLEVAECCMCGIERPQGLLVPDGGGACADIRWYCKDVKLCTERWTAALPDRAEVVMPLSGCVLRQRSAPDGPGRLLTCSGSATGSRNYKLMLKRNSMAIVKDFILCYYAADQL